MAVVTSEKSKPSMFGTLRLLIPGQPLDTISRLLLPRRKMAAGRARGWLPSNLARAPFAKEWSACAGLSLQSCTTCRQPYLALQYGPIIVNFGSYCILQLMPLSATA